MIIHCLPSLTIETAPNPTASIIWLHGLGADGHDFEPVVAELGLPKDLAVRFIFPHAPAMPVSINGGYIMPAWYDIKQQDLGIEHDADGVHASATRIQMLIDQEIMHGIPANRIILAGFSQGAAMALYAGLRQTEPLAGMMALSGYILLPNEFASISSNNLQTPIFMAHGVHDSVVLFEWGESSYRKLQEKGCTVDWHTYPMEHSLCDAEINDIGKWIATIFQQAH
ncbi:MAG: carboxylesterase [Mariprofundaceae bacterium]|nr:carboxylesterase [Mariprofundaceae bacterium]